MQLMKYTAKIVAKQAKLPYSISGLTNDPIYNIKLDFYLSQLNIISRVEITRLNKNVIIK